MKSVGLLTLCVGVTVAHFIPHNAEQDIDPHPHLARLTHRYGGRDGPGIGHDGLEPGPFDGGSHEGSEGPPPDTNRYPHLVRLTAGCHCHIDGPGVGHEPGPFDSGSHKGSGGQGPKGLESSGQGGLGGKEIGGSQGGFNDKGLGNQDVFGGKEQPNKGNSGNRGLTGQGISGGEGLLNPDTVMVQLSGVLGSGTENGSGNEELSTQNTSSGQVLVGQEVGSQAGQIDQVISSQGFGKGSDPIDIKENGSK